MPTLSGPEYLNGQFSVAADGTISLTTPPFSAAGGTISPGPVVISNNTAAPQASPANTLLQLAAVDGGSPRILIDGYGINGSVTLRRSDGTAAAPTAVLANDALGAIGWIGRGATAYSLSRIGINGVAAQNWTDTAQGTFLNFSTTPNGTVATAEAMRIDHNGNVGIGTAAPGAKLDVAGTLRATGQIAPAAGAGVELAYAAGNGYVMSYDRTAAAYQALAIHGSTLACIGDGSLALWTAGADRLHIDNGGNVGIGTTTPGHKLEVNSDIFAIAPSGGQGSVGCFDRTAGNFGAYMFSAPGYTGIATVNNTGAFQAVGLAITGVASNVGIGTTTPGTKLQIGNGTIPTYVRVAGGNSASGDGAAFNVFNGGTSLMSIGNVSVIFGGTYNATGCIWAQNNLILMPQGGAGSVGINTQSLPAILTVNGSCANVSGSWSTISDASVKQDVQPYTRGLDAIVALKPVEFRYAKGTPFAEADKPSRPLFGLIADEVKPHVPEIVGTTTATIGKKEGVELSTLEPGNLIYALINAVKELNGQREEMVARIAALESATVH